MRKVPTSVMVLSIIGIIYGALSLCGGAATIAMVNMDLFRTMPGMRELLADPAYVAFATVGSIVHGILALVLVVSSISSLQLQPWARMSMLVYAALFIVTNLISTVYNYAVVMPRMMSHMPPGSAPGAVGGMVGGLFGIGLAIAFSGCIFYFFTRPHVIDAFHGIFPATPSFPIGVTGPQSPYRPE